VFANVAEGDEADVDHAVAAARRAFEGPSAAHTAPPRSRISPKAVWMNLSGWGETEERARYDRR
jgi:hypothetical protein